MKQDLWFKEFDLKDSENLRKLLTEGFFLVSEPMFNKITGTIDYHLRRTLISILFRNFKVRSLQANK